MSQKLGIEIDTKSNVTQETDKAKSAIVSMEKQVQDVQKKFSTAFKDIFLSFTAPLVLFNAALNMITSAIEKSKQDAREAVDFASKGESKYVSKGEAALAQSVLSAEQDQKEKEMAEKARSESVRRYMKLDEGVLGFGGNADKIIGEMFKSGNWARAAGAYLGVNDLANDPEAQKAAQRLAEQENKGKNMREFSAPQGFSNVVGVGANPALEAMTQQLDVQRDMLDQLKLLNEGKDKQTDFTKDDKLPANWVW